MNLEEQNMRLDEIYKKAADEGRISYGNIAAFRNHTFEFVAHASTSEELRRIINERRERGEIIPACRYYSPANGKPKTRLKTEANQFGN